MIVVYGIPIENKHDNIVIRIRVNRTLKVHRKVIKKIVVTSLAFVTAVYTCNLSGAKAISYL